MKVDRNAITPLAQTDSEIRLAMQPHDNGYVVITIENANGTAYGEFLYVPPKLSEIPPGYITTVAGVGNYVRTFGPANRVTVMPVGVAFDASGNLYVSEPGQHRVTRIDAAGNIHEFAGGNFFLDDLVPDNVPAINGGVSFPWGVAIGPDGNIYIGTHSPLLRMVNPNMGIISTVAGNNRVGFSGDSGPARDAQIGSATAVAADSSGVYFLDWDNARIRRIDRSGIITTVAGNGLIGYSGDGGPATSASFFFGNSDEGCIALGPDGTLYIGDSQNGAIRKVDRATGIITTFYRPPRSGNGSDFAGIVRSLATDSGGNVYYGGSGRIVKLNSKGEFVSSWGAGGYGFTFDGPLTASMQLCHIMGIVIDGAGNIVFADDFFSRVRRINLQTNRLETIAGIYPEYQNENGRAIAAPMMNDNMDLAIGADGNLLIGDFRLRRLDRDGNLQTIAGGHPDPALHGDVPADKMISTCTGIEVNPNGEIDLTNVGDVAHLDLTGTYRTLGGADANCGYDGDGGPFRKARLCQPWDSARDAAGNLYIADTNNNRIRRVDAATMTITTIAGNGGPVNGIERYGQGSYCGDGGPALTACLNTPYGIAIDEDGAIFISEQWTRIRRIAPDGMITTFATDVGGMTKIAFGPGGYLYGVRSTSAGRIARSGNYTALAGGTEKGFSGDGGPALAARINAGFQAVGVAIDAEGNFYFQDSANRRIRAVRYGAVLAPAGATTTLTSSGSTVRATVLDSIGHPAPGVRVDFSVPSSGASCSLSAPFAITDMNGVAAVVCTANCITGTYAVTAQAMNASSSSSISRTNSGGPCHRRSAR